MPDETLPTSIRRMRLAALIAALLLVAAGCVGDEDTAGDTTSTTADATTTTDARSDGDEAVVAVTDDGRAVVLDPDTGEEQRVLLEGISVDDPASNHVTMAPGADEAFVSQPGGPEADPEIVRVPLDGGEPEVLTIGRSPAVSPDGEKLAYVVLEGDLPPEPVLVVRDLSNGEERRLRRETEPSFYGIHRVAWTTDGTALAFTAGEILLGVHVVDADATSLDDARRLGPTARGEEASWLTVTALDEDRLAVAEACCDLPHDDRWLVLAVNLTEGIVEGPLLPDERVEATWLDADEEGRLLVVVRGEDPQLGRSLHRWERSGDLRHLRDGIVVAAW